jgi:hypothetical protein
MFIRKNNRKTCPAFPAGDAKALRKIYSIAATTVLFLFCNSTFAQDKPSGGEVILEPKYATINQRFGIMPVISFYTPNTDFMGATQSTQGLGISYRLELKLNPNSTMKLLVGADYLNEGMKFDTYYFAPGYSVLYDKNFNYTHQLHIHELYIPILFKQGVNDEDKKPNSFYFSGGWAFRYLIGTNYKVTEKSGGQVVAKGFSTMTVEHKFLTDNSGSALLAGLGYEHKLPGMKRSVFFETYYHYNLSRILYRGNNGTNNIKFRNHCLTITVGYEF